MDDTISLNKIEKVTSEILRNLDYKDHDADIDWLEI